MARASDDQIQEVRRLLKDEALTYAAIARLTGLSPQQVGNIAARFGLRRYGPACARLAQRDQGQTVEAREIHHAGAVEGSAALLKALEQTHPGRSYA